MKPVVTSLKDVQQLVKANCKGPLAWLGKRSLDAVGIKDITGFLPLIFSADSGTDVNLFSNETAVFAIENAQPVRQDWSTKHLEEFLSQHNVREVIKMLNGRLTIIPYKTSEIIEQICIDNNWQLLANPTSIREQLADKMHFMKLIKSLGLNVIPNIVIRDITSETYQSIKKRLGCDTFVIQYPHVSSGKGTFLVKDETSFIKAIPFSSEKGVVVRASAFISGTSPNINAICSQNGTLIAPPSHQIVGVDAIRKGFGSYCGNQWLIENGSAYEEELVNQTITLGDYIYDTLGYKGIFGLDGVNKYPLEINARVNGGTQTLTQVLLDNGFIPPIAFHLLELLGVEYTFDVNAYNHKMREFKVERFHICLRNNNPFNSVVYGNVPAGVYKIRKNQLEFVRDGYHIGHALHIGEFVINCGVPKKGLILTPGASLVKLQGPGVAYDPYNEKLTSWGAKIVEIVTQTFDLQPV